MTERDVGHKVRPFLIPHPSFLFFSRIRETITDCDIKWNVPVQEWNIGQIRFVLPIRIGEFIDQSATESSAKVKNKFFILGYDFPSQQEAKR